MRKFQVGDIIAGKANNGYTFTSEGVECKVVSLGEGSTIYVTILDEYKDYKYPVDEDKFDILTKVESAEKDSPEEEADIYVSDFDIEHDDKLGVTFIMAGNATIAVPFCKEIGVTTKHPDDKYSEEIAKAVAFYRLEKGLSK